MSPDTNSERLREEQYALRMKVARMRREIYEGPAAAPPAAVAKGLGPSEAMPSFDVVGGQAAVPTLADHLDELAKAEAQLNAAEAQLAEPVSGEKPGLIIDTSQQTSLLGRDTTGLEAEVYLRMAQVPTAIYHLFDPEENPLISFTVKNHSDKPRRVRLTAFIEDYSASAITTFEIAAQKKDLPEKKVLPTLFPQRLRALNELTRATLNILLEDLDGKIELHQTYPIWLLARTAAPLAVRDPKTKLWNDMSRYYGAFVTPNAAEVLKFLRKAATYHASRLLAGPQRDVDAQARAIFDALKAEEILYVNSLIAFSPDEGAKLQRVRLPRECLKDREANCIDGTLLFASLLEAISLNAALVIVPQHAFVAWNTSADGDDWKYLETTHIGDSTFEEACALAQVIVEAYKVQPKKREKQKRSDVHFWALPDLRTKYDITPLE